jgi:hypothetical protein
MSKQPKSKAVKVVSSVQPDDALTASPMPFSPVPFTVSPGQPVQPLTTPKLRQLVDGGSVTIIGKDGI